MLKLDSKDFRGTEIPRYQTIAGQSFPIGSIGKNDVRFRIQNTTEEECREYAALLKQSGFVEITAKEISAGSECFYNVNLFYAYRKGDACVFVFWDASIHTTFITYESLKELPPSKKLITTEDNTVSQSFTQLQLTSGMCYIAQILSGEFIVVDGGVYTDADEKRLYAFLKEKANEQKPTIALWIFTHSHFDHIEMASHFINTRKNDVAINAFAYQFPNCDKISVEMESVADMKADIESLEKNIKDNFPYAITFTLHTGQSYYYQGLEIEVLWTVDDTYPAHYTSFNDMSAAVRFKFASGKTALLLGDCMPEQCRRIAHTYGDYLKSDILQVAHHGLIGGDKLLYQLVDPEICFWPTPEIRFSGKLPNQRYQWCLGEGGCDYNSFLRDDKIRRRTHYHAGATTTLSV